MLPSVSNASSRLISSDGAAFAHSSETGRGGVCGDVPFSSLLPLAKSPVSVAPGPDGLVGATAPLANIGGAPWVVGAVALGSAQVRGAGPRGSLEFSQAVVAIDGERTEPSLDGRPIEAANDDGAGLPSQGFEGKDASLPKRETVAALLVAAPSEPLVATVSGPVPLIPEQVSDLNFSGERMLPPSASVVVESECESDVSPAPVSQRFGGVGPSARGMTTVAANVSSGAANVSSGGGRRGQGEQATTGPEKSRPAIMSAGAQREAKPLARSMTATPSVELSAEGQGVVTSQEGSTERANGAAVQGKGAVRRSEKTVAPFTGRGKAEVAAIDPAMLGARLVSVDQPLSLGTGRAPSSAIAPVAATALKLEGAPAGRGPMADVAAPSSRPGSDEALGGMPVVGVNPGVNPGGMPVVGVNPGVNLGANRAVRGSSPVSAIPLVLMENGVAMDTPERVTMSRSLSFGESEVGNPAQLRLGSDGSARTVVAAYGSGFAGFSGAASGRSPFPAQMAPIGAIDSNREISQRMPVPAPAADEGEIAPVLVGSMTSLVDRVPAQNSVAGESVMPVNLDESRLVPRSAKNAARLESVAISAKNEILNFNKTLLNVDIDGFTGMDKPVGIDVAKNEVIMAASAHSHSDFGPVLALLPTWPTAVVSGRNHDFSQVETEVTAPAEAAHRAVEAILSAVERFAGAERHSVNLDFSIAGHELSVRVELRADEVRATFCTNSPELRAALAQEWQAVSGGNAREGSVKLGAPIFTANASAGESSAASSFSGGEGFAQKKHSDTRQADAELLRVGAASLVRRPQSVSTNSASAMINAVVPSLASAVSNAVTPSSAHRFWAHA